MTIYFGSVLLNPAAGARRGSFPVGVQEAQQPVDVSAHSGAVKKQTVEPRHAASDEFYHKPYVNHGEQRADAHDVPLPAAEEADAGHGGKHYKGGVEGDFRLREGDAPFAADGDGHTFARHGHRTAAHLQRYADAHDGAAGHLGHNLVGQGDAFERGGEGHVEVDEHTEHKAYHKLQELERRELTAQNDYLRPYEQYIQDVGVHAERQRWNITFGACDGKSQWD